MDTVILPTDTTIQSMNTVIQLAQSLQIKTSNVKGYKIKPPLFSIGVNERMRVFVTYLGFSDKPSKVRYPRLR